MHASDRTAARFLVLMAATAALSLACTALLNLAMDPYSASIGQWYRLRPPYHDDVADRVPDTGTSARASVVAASAAPTLLLGTSRVQVGFETDPNRAFNAGQAAATLEDMIKVAEAAARRPLPPKLYAIEATSHLAVPTSRDRAARPGWPALPDRVIALEATHISAHLLAHTLGFNRPRGMRADFFLRLPPHHAALVRLPEPIPPPFDPGANAPALQLTAVMHRLLRLCDLSQATVVIFEPPVHPAFRSNPDIARVISARIGLYRRVAQAETGSFPKCNLQVVDLSQSDGAAALDPAQWFDGTHFAPTVGRALLPVIERLASGKGFPGPT